MTDEHRQAAQEPVAWMTRFDDPERGSYGKPADTHLEREEAERQVQRHMQRGLCKLRVEPLYTSPPNTDALLRQALEALEYFNDYIEPLTDKFGGPKVPKPASTGWHVEKAISAIRKHLGEA